MAPIDLIKEDMNREGSMLLSAYVSGSNLYNTSSEKSDLDIRGTYALNPDNFLGFKKKQFGSPYKMKNHFGLDSNVDLVIFEIGKAMDLWLHGNMNIIEEFNSVVYNNWSYKHQMFDLCKVLYDMDINETGFYYSCLGLANSQIDSIDKNKGGALITKKMVYASRALMFAKTYFEHGVFESDFVKLLDYNPGHIVFYNILDMKRKRQDLKDPEEIKYFLNALNELKNDLYLTFRQLKNENKLKKWTREEKTQLENEVVKIRRGMING